MNKDVVDILYDITDVFKKAIPDKLTYTANSISDLILLILTTSV